MEEISNTVSDAPLEVSVEQVPATFSFVWLESRLAQFTQVDDASVATKLDRYIFAGVLVFALLGVSTALLLRNQLGLRVLQVCVVLEWLCGVAFVVHTLWQGWRFYQQQHRGFARELDEQLVQYNAIVGAIRSYPLPVICTNLRYVRDRKNRLTYRAGLLSGGYEKFGILPLLAVMYLQFKDWSFGDWKALTDHVHALSSFLLLMLACTYLVSWWAVRTKSRLDLYEVVLTEASVRESDEQEKGAN